MENPQELLELCKKCNEVKAACIACEEYRKIVSGLAVKNGEHKILQEFYKSADTTEENLLLAIMNNDLEIVKILLSGVSIKKPVLDDMLLHAIMGGNLQIIQKLIDKGANNSRAISATISTGNIPVLELLLKNGYKLGKKSLTDAINTGKIEMIEAILNNGVTPTAKDLTNAVKGEQWHLVKPLYDAVKNIPPEIQEQIESRFEIKRAHFPNGGTNFEEQLTYAYKDLKSYPPEEIKIMAKQMNIDCDGKDFDHLCKQVAYKIMYTNTPRIPNANEGKCQRYTKKIAPAKLNEIRQKIYKQFSKFKNSVTKMGPKDLHSLLKAYDDICFNGDIFRLMGELHYTLQFKLDGEPTFTTEGICLHDTCDYTITIPTKFFASVKGETNVAGHICHDQLECLMRVIEHEMCHLIIFVFCTDIYIADQHGPLFMNTISELFGHTDHRHYIF